MMVSTPYPMAPQHQQSMISFSPISRNLGDRAMPQQPYPPMQDVIFSPKHAGLYLYLIRLLRPIWKKKCITSTDGFSSLTHEDCSDILSELRALKVFLEEIPLNIFSGMQSICLSKLYFN